MKFANFAFMQWRTNKLSDLKRQYIKELLPIYGKEEAETMLNILIKRYFSMTRSQMAILPDHRLTESEMLRLHFAIKELKKHRPIQYILKHVDFLNTRILVNESVLIPRPETEEMVQFILEREKGRTGMRLLDIGTGSGCIAIALARNLKDADVTGIDTSGDALRTATKNLFINEVMVHFELRDMLDPDSLTALGQFDVIVSNPPYVTEQEKTGMKSNVLEFEPHEALFVPGNDPLLFYRAILYIAGESLLPGGRIYFEVSERYGSDVRSLLREQGYDTVEMHRDLAGRDRFVSAAKPEGTG